MNGEILATLRGPTSHSRRIAPTALIRDARAVPREIQAKRRLDAQLAFGCIDKALAKDPIKSHHFCGVQNFETR